MEHQNELAFSAVISAAGQASDDLALRIGTAEKCAARLRDEPICSASLGAALGAGASEVAVVCGSELRAALGPLPERCVFAEPGAGPVESAQNGCRALSDFELMVFLPGDLPFVEAGHVAGFVSRCPKNAGPWVAAGVCDKADVTARFAEIPGMKYTTLSRKKYAGGGIFAASPEGFVKAVGLATRFAQNRKSQFRMAWQFGIPNMLKLLAGRMSIDGAESAASKLFGCEARIITGCAPELIADVDTVEDWEFAKSFHRSQVS